MGLLQRITGFGSAGNPDSGVVTTQGIAGGTAMPVTLPVGQQAMANSVPVAIASDQSNVPTTLNKLPYRTPSLRNATFNNQAAGTVNVGTSFAPSGVGYVITHYNMSLTVRGGALSTDRNQVRLQITDGSVVFTIGYVQGAVGSIGQVEATFPYPVRPTGLDENAVSWTIQAVVTNVVGTAASDITVAVFMQTTNA